MVEQLGRTLVPPHKRSGDDEISMPEIGDINSVSDLVLSKSDIVVLTGERWISDQLIKRSWNFCGKWNPHIQRGRRLLDTKRFAEIYLIEL